MERDGLRSLLSPPEPQLKPDVAPEPATTQAADLAGDVAPTAAELEADGQASIWDVVPDGKTVDGETVYATGDELLARADRDGDYADLVEACRS